jgi:hypothetical protein
MWMRRTAWAVTLTLAVAVLNCATAPDSPRRNGPRPAADPELRARERAAGKEVERAERALELGDYAAADSLADRVVASYADTRWLGRALLISARASLERNEPAEARAEAARYLKLYRAADPARAPGLVIVARTLYQEGRAVEAADREGRPMSSLPADSPVRLAVLEIAQKVGLI